MARGYPPAYGHNQTGSQRSVMSVAELERRYGRNAQVELRSPPDLQSPPLYQPEPEYLADPGYAPNSGGYYDPDAYDDPVEVPVKRSPWLPVVVLMMLGIGALLGYGLYNRGLVPTQLLGSKVALQRTESLPVERDWKALPALPHISTGVVTSINAAKPAAPVPGAETATDEAAGGVVGPAARPAPNGEDDAATLEMIRRERERLDEIRGTSPNTAPTEPSTEPSTEAEPTPPGYIEAETP
ncbi:MAG TPA: hypothetical protein VK524_19825 [Polyangiaceae bacterium]|nr:hypothetical protein [Polyangiaceae bacterium]